MSIGKADLLTAEVTNRIVADLEQGVRPWLKPWKRRNTPPARITRPLRHNGQPDFAGINVVMLWTESMDRGFACPISG